MRVLEYKERDMKMDIKDIKIEDMDFSVRTYNCLKRALINTLKDLSKCTTYDLKRVRNLGQRGLKEVIDKCAKYGVEIKEEA